MPQPKGVTLRDVARRRLASRSAERPGSKPVFLDEKFPAQCAFISDPAKLKTALCTRRSGKSYGAGLYLFKEAYETPGVSCLYIALTRDSAKKILWKDVLKPINRRLGLNARFNETELTATLPNGSVIYLLGVDSAEEEKQKLLGQKYKLVVIDEAAAFTVNLHELVYGVLKPAVADYRGTICLVGTPGNVKAGLYYELTGGHDGGAASTWTTRGWSGHSWSALENPYIRTNWLAEIEELKAANPTIEQTPLFQQHYLGRWVIDDSLLVYKYLPGRNDFDGTLPAFRSGRWHYVLGIDQGFRATAFTLVAYHDHCRELFVLESWKRRGMDVTDMANIAREYDERYALQETVIDGAAKQAVEEMSRRHGVNLEAAEKQGKMDFIDIINSELLQGRIRISTAKWEGVQLAEHTDVGRCGTGEYVTEYRCGNLISELTSLVIDERALMKGKREEHPGCENDCCDSFNYPVRKTYPYLSTPLAPPPPRPGSFEFQQMRMEADRREMEEMFERERQELIARKREEQEFDEWFGLPADWRH
ncbi:MAG: DEAD/DEAH box helicase family protein [Myxococcaceae bacterium]